MVLTVTVLAGGAECVICVIIPGSLLCNGCNGTEDAQCFVQILFIKFATVSHSEPGRAWVLASRQSRAERPGQKLIVFCNGQHRPGFAHLCKFQVGEKYHRLPARSLAGLATVDQWEGAEVRGTPEVVRPVVCPPHREFPDGADSALPSWGSASPGPGAALRTFHNHGEGLH